MKLKYIEIKPTPQTLDFESSGEWREFIDKRLKEVIDYIFANNLKFDEYFEYKRVLINKDGTPRKQINPTWLHSAEAHKKQKIKWEKYCEARKVLTNERNYRRKLADIQTKIDYWKSQKEEIEKEHEN